MSEPDVEYNTGSESTAFASAPWEPEGPDQNGHAHVWGLDGDLVATVCDNPVYGETAEDRARLIAAAGTAAQEAREMGYDPVAAVEAFPQILTQIESLLQGEFGHEGVIYPLLTDLLRELGGSPLDKDAPTSAEGSDNE